MAPYWETRSKPAWLVHPNRKGIMAASLGADLISHLWNPQHGESPGVQPPEW
ncbi:Hypothetical protein SMAX5B_020482 [Scophthalmus maximus]|uniref:Uncharacterized protein n=1 Tax=Scophthalmus maximus TaxID=52904 RepID=A0A2U9C1P9_SCOMX|nr:Hypothetical protein SMAX5B_020482 [Scophthalmus maximus]